MRNLMSEYLPVLEATVVSLALVAAALAVPALIVFAAV